MREPRLRSCGQDSHGPETGVRDTAANRATGRGQLDTPRRKTRRSATSTLRRGRKRRGAAVVLAAVGAVTLLGMAALAVDVGMLYAVRSELQVSADAAALAAAWELLGDGRLKGATEQMDVFVATRQAAATYAALNRVADGSPLVDLNAGNSSGGDVVLGYLADPTDLTEQMSFADPDRYNSVLVRVRRNAIRNGPVDLLFARVFGLRTADLGAEATASFLDGVVGYRVTAQSGNAELLPLSLHEAPWAGLLAGTQTTGDNYAYDPQSGAVTQGSDGINELNLFPGAGPTQLTPGNFGTVDIGSPDNSTADLARQIRYGVSAEDLAYFGGELVLGTNGTLTLNGDTGLSAGVKDDLEAVKGMARAIPLFSQVTGPGDNATFTVVGFAGIRIVNVRLTGPMDQKEVVIQPAVVVDDAAVSEAYSTASDFVYQPVRIVR